MEEDCQDILLEPLLTSQSILIGEYPESPNEHVRDLARQNSNMVHPLFCEMLELRKSATEYCWSESARWIKFEETVEDTRERWSKPHIPLLTLKGLLQLKNCFKRGVVLLDLNVQTFTQLIEKLIECWEEEKLLNEENSELIRDILLSNREHVMNKKGLRLKLNTIASLKRMTNEYVDHTAVEHALNGSPIIAADEERNFNTDFSKKLPENAEVAIIQVGKTDHIDFPLSAFVRLNEPMLFHNCSEVNRKIRFLFVLLSNEEGNELDMVGRTLACALVDDVFVHSAYLTKDRMDLYYALDEIISSSLIIPPGKWSVDCRLEPSATNTNIMTRRSETFRSYIAAGHSFRKSLSEFHADGLSYTGKLFGGLVDDIRRKMPYYVSDFTSVFKSPNAFTKCLAASLYLFFVNFTNIITFGGIMGQMLNKEMAVIECIVSGCLCGLIFGLFAGQPLNIMSATGPVLIFETLFMKFCKEFHWSFLPVRFWLGFWTAAYLFLLVAFDASFLVAFITRFTEESFATLISVIFIVESFQAMLALASKSPITVNVSAVLNDPCVCKFADDNEIQLNYSQSFYTTNDARVEDCKKFNGTAVGAMCSFQPDVFVFSLLLFLSTFVLAYTFHCFRSSRFFPTKIRSLIGDFNVFITIVIMSLINYSIGIPAETLQTPTKFEPTQPRSWIVDMFEIEHYWIALATSIPALLLTVLIVMDQQITAVIVNRKQNKLMKGFGYHLDLLVVAVLIVLCSLLGIPFFVAATVLSITHVQSLKIQSDCSAPGEKPRFLGVHEQRVTTIVAHLLIGLSIFLAAVQRHIPISVLLGIFLYMGVTSLLTQQFVDRILLLFTPVKYQPDYGYLRVVPLKRVFLFTGIQLGAFAILCLVKYTKIIPMLFPIVLVVLVFIRKSIEKIFTQKELFALDDLLPNWRSLLRSKSINQPRRSNADRSSMPLYQKQQL